MYMPKNAPSAGGGGGGCVVPPFLLLLNNLSPLFIYADKCLLALARRYKILLLLRYLLVSAFFFLLRLLLPVNPSCSHHLALPKDDASAASAAGGDSGIARALSQLLATVGDLPVSSRKYDVVRSLAGSLIDENLREGYDCLREVNRSVLSEAFSRTLSRLERAVVDQNRIRGVWSDDGSGGGPPEGVGRDFGSVSWVLRAAWYYGDAALNQIGMSLREEASRTGISAEKLVAEVLWLAQKLAVCGCVEEAVGKWASATHLAWLALSAEPRLQGPLVKVSAFLFQQAKDLGGGKGREAREMKMKMLMSWLPLLCRASNGTDAPVLSMGERAEVERVLEETIDMLDQEQQEKVLSLWLHHFTHCPSSDWPNLRPSYTRWCTASRRLLLPYRHSSISDLIVSSM